MFPANDAAIAMLDRVQLSRVKVQMPLYMCSLWPDSDSKSYKLWS